MYCTGKTVRDSARRNAAHPTEVSMPKSSSRAPAERPDRESAASMRGSELAPLNGATRPPMPCRRDDQVRRIGPPRWLTLKRGTILSTLYLLALCGVAFMLLAAVVEALLAVSRKPDWTVKTRRLHLVHAVDRRSQAVPFVGAERRGSQFQDLTSGEQHRRRA